MDASLHRASPSSLNIPDGTADRQRERERENERPALCALVIELYISCSLDLLLLNPIEMLAAINAAIVGAPAIQNGFNGAAGVVSLAENISHIDATSKLVVDQGEVCLGQSLALQAVELLGLAPNAPAIGAVTQAHFDSFRSKWSDTLGVFQLYSVAAAGVPQYRNADLLSIAAYTARVGANGPVLEAFAAGMLAHFQADAAAASEFSGHAHFIALNAVRAAHHRAFSDGHNGKRMRMTP